MNITGTLFAKDRDELTNDPGCDVLFVNEHPLKTIVVEDEPPAARILLRYVQQDSGLQMLKHCCNGIQAVNAIKELNPDLVFLDVQLPGMNGFQVLESIRNGRMPFVIFVTAYDDFAVQAFEFHALDYLLKPYNVDRFKKAVTHAKMQIKRHEESHFFREITGFLGRYRTDTSGKVDPEPLYPRRLEIRSAAHISFINVEEIDWIEASDNYVILHTSSGSHLMRERMNRLQMLLDPQIFLRIHRSTIVNVRTIKGVKSRAFGDRAVVLNDGTKLPVSRAQKKNLKRSLTTF